MCVMKKGMITVSYVVGRSKFQEKYGDAVQALESIEYYLSDAYPLLATATFEKSEASEAVIDQYTDKVDISLALSEAFINLVAQ